MEHSDKEAKQLFNKVIGKLMVDVSPTIIVGTLMGMMWGIEKYGVESVLEDIKESLSVIPKHHREILNEDIDEKVYRGMLTATKTLVSRNSSKKEEEEDIAEVKKSTEELLKELEGED